MTSQKLLELTKFERALYYPVALTCMFYTTGLWLSGNINFRSPEIWVASIITVTIWLLPFLGKYFSIARVIMWIGFSLVAFGWILLSPWVVGLVLSKL